MSSNNSNFLEVWSPGLQLCKALYTHFLWEFLMRFYLTVISLSFTNQVISQQNNIWIKETGD